MCIRDRLQQTQRIEEQSKETKEQAEKTSRQIAQQATQQKQHEQKLEQALQQMQKQIQKQTAQQIQQISEQIHKQNIELRNEVTVQLNQEKANNQNFLQKFRIDTDNKIQENCDKINTEISANTKQQIKELDEKYNNNFKIITETVSVNNKRCADNLSLIHI